MVMTDTPWYKYCNFLVLIYSEYEEVFTITTTQLLFQDSTTSASTIPTNIAVTTVITRSTNAFTTSQLLFQDSTTSASTIPTNIAVTTVITRSTNMVITLTATSECNTISTPTSVVSRPTADISVVRQPTVNATTGNS